MHSYSRSVRWRVSHRSQAPGVLGAKLSSGQTHDLALFALDVAQMEAEGVKCDGRSCFVRRGPQGILAAAMHNGVRLEAGGQLLLAADGPGHMTWSVGERELTATISVPHATRVTLFAPHKPKAATVDGKPAPFRYDANAKCVTPGTGGEHTIRMSL
jgi:hypothetical protein